MKTIQFIYVVNTPYENHFFFNSKEARKDYADGKSWMKKQGDIGEIAIYKMPVLKDEEGEIVDFDSDCEKYFHENLDTKNCNKILSEEIY